MNVPVSSVGGWYDIFLPGQLRDFQVLQSLGRRPRLTVGPWTHLSMDPAPVREAIEFGLAHARGEEPPPRPPVRLYVMGEDYWRDFETWPPAGYAPVRYYLGAGGRRLRPPLRRRPRRALVERLRRPDPADRGAGAGRGRRQPVADRLPVQARTPHPGAGVERRFPRFARNHGTGEPYAIAARLVAADQCVYHDPARPSAITLPVGRL